MGAIQAEKLANNVPGIPNPIYVNVGGDVIPGTAIAGVPYADSGNTCSFAHQYDAVCPYNLPGAPDVVYNITPASALAIDIDLCSSGYDTKVWVQAANGSVLCCNDDAGCGSTGFQSFIECCQLSAGTTYYIIVDGWSSTDCGTYNMVLSECTPCIVDCPPGGVLEGEPTCGDNYSDQYNGGCNSNPPVFTEIECDGDGDGSTTVCGEMGGFLYFGSSYRDTDWYQITLDAPKTISWCVTSELDQLIGIIDGRLGCPVLSFYDYAFSGSCTEACVTQSLPAGTWWFFAATSGFGPGAGACGSNYNATLSGLNCPPVSVDAASWGSIKGLYR